MLSKFMSSVDGLDVFAIVMMIVAIAIFSWLMLRVARMKKSDADRISTIPLEDDKVIEEKL